MEQFNLERALSGEPVITRDGREVTQLIQFDTTERNIIFGVVNGVVRSWCSNGEYITTLNHKNDLFMKYPKDELFVFINVYKVTPAMPSEKPYLTIGVYESDKDAYKSAITKMEQDSFAEFIGTIKITDNLKDL